jgi:hypothetical protein
MMAAVPAASHRMVPTAHLRIQLYEYMYDSGAWDPY